MNVAHLLGKVITDPTLEESNSGRKICRFRLSTSNGKNLPITRHFIVILGKDQNDEHPSNVYNLVKRGSKLQVSGRISESTWISRNTGVKHSRTEIIATSVEFVALYKGEPSEQTEPVVSQENNSADD